MNLLGHLICQWRLHSSIHQFCHRLPALFYKAQLSPPPIDKRKPLLILEKDLVLLVLYFGLNKSGKISDLSIYSPMELQKEDSQEDARECPVCYECLSCTERTLSCGHAFCHDCLVKTVVRINIDGNIRDTIVCPICRHLTFIKKQNEALVSLAEGNNPDEAQTLEVPLPVPVELQGARRVNGDRLPRGVRWISHCIRGIFERLRLQRLISPSHNACQIFIISAEGRPMAEDDALRIVMTVVQPQRRRRRRICTTARCLFILLSAFTILALVAATLPWIILA